MAYSWTKSCVYQLEKGQKLRLDPCHLPQTIAYIAQKTDLLHICSLSEKDILIRAGSGSENGKILQHFLPRHFRGIAAKNLIDQEGQSVISLTLLHEIQEYSIPLLLSSARKDSILDWRLWSDIYDLPMLFIDETDRVIPAAEQTVLQYFIHSQPESEPSKFLLRCRGLSLNIHLAIGNQVMLG